MAEPAASGRTAVILELAGFDALLAALAEAGFTLIGPRERDGAITLEPIAGRADLPAGRRDRQGPGHYRLEDRDDGALFGFASPPHAWKRHLHPPEVRLMRARSTGSGFEVTDSAGDHAPPRLALIGVKPCDLAAIAAQDQVFGLGRDAPESQRPDPTYAGRRRAAFIIALDCGHAAETCFCDSLGSGPAAPEDGGGADLVLGEILDGGHRFLVRATSPTGARLLDALPKGTARPAKPADLKAAAAIPEATRAAQKRRLDPDHREIVGANLESPHWARVGERCLACANCTMVCPTCFCATVEDSTDLAGDIAERWRRWDSCFTMDFSYIHGGSIRIETASRYRQWMSHKLTSWHEQFGRSGCTGCGRCIAWCPVGIDLTEETARLAGSDPAQNTAKQDTATPSGGG